MLTCPSPEILIQPVTLTQFLTLACRNPRHPSLVCWCSSVVPLSVVRQAYSVMVPGAAKADIWRLAVVWRYGGVYVDSDVVALRPFREVPQGLGLSAKIIVQCDDQTCFMR